MPKVKTHSGASKRFKITGSGKIMRERANRRLAMEAEMVSGDAKRIKKLLKK